MGAWVLAADRFLQGVGAAAFVPASLSLLGATFAEGEERNRAFGVYGALGALGFVVGMVGGGEITEFNPDHADEEGELAATFVRAVADALAGRT